MVNIEPIRTEEAYRQALARVSELVDLNPKYGTDSNDELEILSILVEAYEAKNYAFESPDPIEAIKFRMEQQGLGVKDLEPAIGKSNRVYEILNRKRPLTVRMIRNLNQQLGIPAEVLIQEEPSKRAG